MDSFSKVIPHKQKISRKKKEKKTQKGVCEMIQVDFNVWATENRFPD